MLKLRSIKLEAAAARKRCAKLKIGDIVLHCHHEVFAEPLTEPVENRIRYIIESKTDNVALRLRLISPVKFDAEARKDSKLSKAYAEWSKAGAEYSKAYAERSKADAEWSKAGAECNQARAARDKADAEYDKADAERSKAYAEWNKAGAEYDKAHAEYSKAHAEYSKAYAERGKASAEFVQLYTPHYKRVFQNSPWNGKTIFAGEFKL